MATTQGLCSDSFHLGLKVVSEALGLNYSHEDYSKIWAALNAVADGSETLNISPADLVQKAGDILPAMRAHLQETQEASMRTERQLARVIVDYADGKLAELPS
jgi:hypothetical protein